MTGPTAPVPAGRVRPDGHPPVVLTIAGSDPSCGAGIQADLKTFSALGSYGCAVITALTAQNTRGVTGVFPIPADFVTRQLDTLFADVGIDAVKIGMIADAEIAAAVAAALRTYRPPYVVLDPVMVASSGDRLLRADAEAVVRAELLPLADLVTPNLDEAAALLGVDRAADGRQARDQVRALRDVGASRVLVKGGHFSGAFAVDYLGDADGTVHELTARRIDTVNTHGTGCTLSSAIAALRPHAPDWLTAVARGKDYLTASLAAADSLVIGGTGSDRSAYSGHGPVHHFSGGYAFSSWAGSTGSGAVTP
jgi:hydroxymethylpyrimidine/phosphomethylpyrimidine kinase